MTADAKKYVMVERSRFNDMVCALQRCRCQAASSKNLGKPASELDASGRFFSRISPSSDRKARHIALGLSSTVVYEGFVRMLVAVPPSITPQVSDVAPEDANTAKGAIQTLRHLGALVKESVSDAKLAQARGRMQLLLMLSCANLLETKKLTGVHEVLQSLPVLAKYGDRKRAEMLQGAAWARNFVAALSQRGWSCARATELFVLSAPAASDWRYLRMEVTDEVEKCIAHLKEGPGYVTHYTVPGLIVELLKLHGAIPGLFSVAEVYSYFKLEEPVEDIFRVSEGAPMKHCFVHDGNSTCLPPEDAQVGSSRTHSASIVRTEIPATDVSLVSSSTNYMYDCFGRPGVDCEDLDNMGFPLFGAS